MKRFNKIVASVLVCTGILVLSTGCAKGNKATETTLYIEKNGKITEAIVEDWNQDYYDEDEFKKEIDEQITSYEASHDGSKISLNKLEIKKNKAKVNLEYDSMETFEEFNNITAFSGTVKQAQKEGFSFDGEFKSTGNKPSITVEEINNSEEYNVIILLEDITVSTEFKILYAGSNVKVEDDCKVAVISEAESNLAYLIYKK